MLQTMSEILLEQPFYMAFFVPCAMKRSEKVENSFISHRQ